MHNAARGHGQVTDKITQHLCCYICDYWLHTKKGRRDGMLVVLQSSQKVEQSSNRDNFGIRVLLKSVHFCVLGRWARIQGEILFSAKKGQIMMAFLDVNSWSKLMKKSMSKPQSRFFCYVRQRNTKMTVLWCCLPMFWELWFQHISRFSFFFCKYVGKVSLLLVSRTVNERLTSSILKQDRVGRDLNKEQYR